MRRGFSLIEVLVAGILLALVGLMLMTTLNSSVEVKERVDSISTRYYLIRQAMARMTQEISMAYISSHKNISSPVIDTQFIGKKSSLSFVAFGGYARLKDARQSDQREITYFVTKKGGVPSLMRKEKVNPTNKIGTRGRSAVLCPKVKSIKFQYWNSKFKKWDSSWSTEGQDRHRTLPTRVLIEIVAILENEIEKKFVTETEIWINKPIKIME